MSLVLAAQPAVAGTDTPWIKAKGKAAKGRFVSFGDWLQVCDLKKKDGWYAGIFMFGQWNDGDELGAVVTDKPGECASAPFQYVVQEGFKVRIMVCKVRKEPWKLAGCSRKALAQG